MKIFFFYKYIALIFNDIMSKDVGYVYVLLFYVCFLKIYLLRLNLFSKW